MEFDKWKNIEFELIAQILHFMNIKEKKWNKKKLTKLVNTTVDIQIKYIFVMKIIKLSTLNI